MKKLLLIIFTSLFCVFLVSCGSNTEEETQSNPLDIQKEITEPVSEVSILAGVKEVHITDSAVIKEVVDTICSTEFQLSKKGDINEPGAASVKVDLLTESGIITITFPYTLRDGNVYEAGADSIQLFDKYFK